MRKPRRTASSYNASGSPPSTDAHATRIACLTDNLPMSANHSKASWVILSITFKDNTDEVLSALEKAIENGLTAIGMTAEGHANI